jgi:hypothetical protein
MKHSNNHYYLVRHNLLRYKDSRYNKLNMLLPPLVVKFVWSLLCHHRYSYGITENEKVTIIMF